jgi:hypothetical protein
MKLKRLIENLIAIVALYYLHHVEKCSGSQSKLVTVKDSTSYALGSIQTEGMVKQMKALQIFDYIDVIGCLKVHKIALTKKS